MNGDLAPAVVALGGGSVMLGAFGWHEHNRLRAMRADRSAFTLTFPVGLGDAAAQAAMASLAGVGESAEVVLSVFAGRGSVTHQLLVPTARAQSVIARLKAALPGLRVEPAEAALPATSSTLALRLFVPRLALLRTEDVGVAARGLLMGLGRLRASEQLVYSWAIQPAELRHPTREAQSRVDRELERAVFRRAAEPTFAASGLVLVAAASRARARELADTVGQAVRARHGLGTAIRQSYEYRGRRLDARPSCTRSGGRLTARELAGLVPLPLGDHPIPGVRQLTTPQLFLPASVPRDGNRLFVGRDASGERPATLAGKAATLHLSISGPTGSGKSTIVIGHAVDAIRRRESGGLVIDPKRDTAIAIANGIDPADVDRVVLMDVGRRDAAIGLDLFVRGNPDVQAEVVTSVLRGIFGPQGAWGVRSDHYISLGLRTIAELANPSLLLIPRLFSDAAFRRQAVARLDDPVLRATWAEFEMLSASEAREHLAAPLNRVMSVLRQPLVRGVIAQPSPKLDLGALWRRKGWLLVSLDPGQIGEGAARLIGAILSFVAWSTLEASTALPEAERPPVTLIFDELNALTDGIPTSIEGMAERSRALGGRLIVGFQSVGRLPTSTADAVFGNFSSLLTFRPGSEAEAKRLAAQMPGLTASDLLNLGAYEVAARLATGDGTGIAVATGRTEPLPEPTGMLEAVAARSIERYGTSRADLDAAIREQLDSPPDDDDRPAPGLTRRRS
jgi:Type IV secretion-system coupling protein DNA-binding domain